MWTRELADVEAGERGAAELDEPEPEPVAARRVDALHQSRGRKRRQLA